MKAWLAGLAMAFAGTGLARAEGHEGFVDSNLIAIFYHELGHAIIDILDLPVFGQEEDAADVLSVLLIDSLFEEETAVAMVYDTAFGFLADADALEQDGEEVPFWDTHGPDLQRYYTLVCLFYGANPEERADVAEDLDLPEERAETCEEEFELAYGSWGPVLDELAEAAPGESLKVSLDAPEAEGAELTRQILSAEIEAMNEDFAFPQELTVHIDSCGEANAFYDPTLQAITMCTEFATHLTEIALGSD